jgi:gamma-glutamyltranspeptidase/glutathione hydrolase
VAEAIDAYVGRAEVADASGRRHRGLLTGEDMASWEPAFEDPARFDYRGFTVCKTGPWGQGPVFLQQLALLSGFDLDEMDPGGADFIHTVVECSKLAFADREAWYGDPSRVDVPLNDLLAPEYADERRTLVGPDASLELRPGDVAGRTARLPRLPSSSGEEPYGRGGEPTMALRRDTCHLDVADRFGNLVSATPSGGWLHGSPVIPELGFPLGTRGQMFWLEEGLPGSLEPGKRPRTTLSPSLALRDGHPYLAFGTPGGDMQDQWTLVFWLYHVVFGMNLQEAIDFPMFHSEHFPSSFYPRESCPGRVMVEGRLDLATIAELQRRGHEVIVGPDWCLGRISAVAQDKGAGVLKGAANPRGMQGYAAGR